MYFTGEFMKIICVDDEPAALERLAGKVKKILPDAVVSPFRLPEDAYSYVRSGFEPDIAFLDIEMIGMNGIELALRIKNISPNTKICFVTGFSQYAITSYKIHAHGYLLKPVTDEELKDNIEYLTKSDEKVVPAKDIVVKCFGNFEIFYKGEILRFPRSKSKELLAYLVDKNGSSATTQECIGFLYEDRNDVSARKMFANVVHELTETLKSKQIENLLIHTRNAYAINTEMFDCDIYDALKGDIDAIHSFKGEYMAQYSWAEETCSYLYYKLLKNKN